MHEDAFKKVFFFLSEMKTFNWEMDFVVYENIFEFDFTFFWCHERIRKKIKFIFPNKHLVHTPHHVNRSVLGNLSIQYTPWPNPPFMLNTLYLPNLKKTPCILDNLYFTLNNGCPPCILPTLYKLALYATKPSNAITLHITTL